MEVKVIKNHRIPPFFYKKNYYKQPLYIAIFGLLGCLIFIVKAVCSEFSDNIKFTEDDVIGLLIFAILFGMFSPIALILYVSSTLVEIIESIVNDKQSEQKSLSENK